MHEEGLQQHIPEHICKACFWACCTAEHKRAGSELVYSLAAMHTPAEGHVRPS